MPTVEVPIPYTATSTLTETEPQPAGEKLSAVASILAAKSASGHPVYQEVGRSHVVQFFETDDALVEAVARYIGGGLAVGDRVLIIATPEHQEALQKTFNKSKFAFDQCVADGDLLLLDARQTLALFMVDRTPDAGLFAHHVGGIIAKLAAGGHRVRAFGEMVALLHQDGNSDATLRLEELWNELPLRQPFTLLCAYSLKDFPKGDSTELFRDICATHTAVLPVQDASGQLLKGGLGELASLQQRAQALDIETARRKSAENARALLAAIVDSSDDAIISKSLDSIITSWNSAATRIFGYTADEMIGESVSKLFPPDRLAEEDKIISQLKRGQRVEHFETVRLRKDGTPVDVSLTISPVRDASGQLIGASKIARDITEHKRSQRLLKEREEFLRAIIDTTPDCIKMIDKNGSVQEMNPAGLVMVGADQIDQVRGKCVYDLIAPEDRKKYIAFNEAVCEGEGGFLEFDLIAFNGIRRSMETYAVPLATPNGQRVHLGLTRDATDRKHAERLLRDSEGQFRQLANAMPQIVWTARPDGFADYFNDRWYEYTGFPRDTFGEASWVPILHPEDLERCRSRFYESMLTGVDFHLEYRFKDRTNGGYRWFLGRATPVRDDHGKIIRWFGTSTDIDATKRTEERLARRNERLSLLNEAAGHLLAAEEPAEMVRGIFKGIRDHLGVDAFFNFVFDESGNQLSLLASEGIPESARQKILRLNLGQAVCGTSAQERRPIIAIDIQNSNDPKVQLVKELGIRAFACNPLMVEHRLLGTLSFASRTRNFFYEDELEFIRTLCHYVSIAFERVRLVKQLRGADRRKDEFLATLAHELRNPLAPIQSSIDLLRRTPGAGPMQTQLGEIMERQVRQLTRLVDELLEVARITSGKISLRRESLDIAAVMQNALDTSRPQLDKAGHVLHVSLPPETILVDGDAVRLAQVFVNLLNNAVKYTDSPGTIDFSLQREQGEAVVRLRDSGVGIPHDMLPRVFDMFAQVDRTLNRAQGGLGIGLALARKLIELHGGRIEARSEGPGKGSEFIVHLPRIESHESTVVGNADGGTGPAVRHHRVLVVDDNRDAALALSMLLQTYRHTTRVAFDGLQALEMAEEFKPDIVLMDIGMPHMDGYEVAARMRRSEWSLRTKLIALTGWGQEEDRQKARAAGFDYHFTKPVDVAALVELMGETRA